MEVKFYVMSGTRQIVLVSKALNDLEPNKIVLLIDTYGYTNAMNTGINRVTLYNQIDPISISIC